MTTATLFGCAPEIGDACETSADCSVNGDRVCDTAQPDGYCTLRNCDPNTCPEESRCVEWRFDPIRTSVAWCMASCEGDGDCRNDEGYRCLRATDAALLENGTPIARVLDDGAEGARFCAWPRMQ